jgi:integrase
VKLRKMKDGWLLDSGRIMGSRIRKLYTTEKAAKEALDRAQYLSDEVGKRLMMVWIGIPACEVAEIIRYRQDILALQSSPNWAKGRELHLAYVKSISNGGLLIKLVAEYVARKTKGGKAKEYVRRLERDLGKFAAKHPHLTAADVTDKHIDSFLDDLRLEGITRDNRVRDIRGLFSFAQKLKLCEGNPADLTEPIKIVKRRIKTFTLREIAALLWVADHHPEWELIPYIALGSWGSARACEAFRLDWANLQVGEKVLVYEAAATKTNQERVAENLPEVLLDWLKPYVEPSGPMSPPETTVEWRRSRFLVPAVKKLLPDFKWVHNGLRKSSISAEFAASKDARAVAVRHGTSPEMLFRNYRAVMLQSDGEAYFRLTRTGIVAHLRGVVPDAELDAWLHKHASQTEG